MKKLGTIFVLLIIASLVLTACQPKDEPSSQQEPGNEIVVQNPSDGFVPNLAGEITECSLKSLIPEIPAAQIPPIPTVSEEDWVLGSMDAETSIIVYSDFQCPYCAVAAPQLEQFQVDNADSVNLVFRHLPLIGIHPIAMPAHQAAEAAGLQGKFFEMHDVLFENQQKWATEIATADDFLPYALELAEDLNLDLEQFENDYSDSATQEKIALAYMDATENIGITGTPSVFITINGIPFSASYDYNTLTSILKLIELDANRYKDCPPMVIDVEKTYEATITTSKGDVVVELYPDKAPLAVNSFVFLAIQGFYNDVDFHRVIPGFVAQVGDPSGLGMGGPGYQYVNEISDLTFDSEGVLGVANSGVDSNGSQFFITYAPQTSLDGGYTVFGKVIEGMENVTNLNAVDPQQGIMAETLDKILSITIKEK
jgi:cyclophilin family peptidyl-prolyl cis-trans isomerase/protein-disulfide isomerase